MEQYKVLSGTKSFDIQYFSTKNIIIDGIIINPQILSNNSGLTRIKIENNCFNVYCKEIGENIFELWIHHYVFNVKLEDSRARLLSRIKNISSSEINVVNVKAPMPGLVKAVEVKKGDIVEKGGGLIILEAMKMENEIRSSIKGKIKSVEVHTNHSVEKDQILVIIEPIC